MSNDRALKPKRKIRIIINRRKDSKPSQTVATANQEINPANSLHTLKKALQPREPGTKPEENRDILEESVTEVRLEREVAPPDLEKNIIPMKIKQRDSSASNNRTVFQDPARPAPARDMEEDLEIHARGEHHIGDAVRKEGPETESLGNDLLLKDRYRIMGLIKQDNLRRIYLGMDESVSPSKPVKVIQIRSSKMERTSLDKRNHKLCEILRKLSVYHHPHAARISDAFRHMERQYYIVDYVKGKNLKQILREHQGKLTEEDAADVGIALCDVLGFLQFRRIPFYLDRTEVDDLVVDDKGVLKLTKFNLHLLFDSARGTELIPRSPENYFDQVNWIAKIVFYLLTGEEFRVNIDMKKVFKKIGLNMRKLFETTCPQDQKKVGDLRVLRKMLEKAPIRTRKESNDIQKFSWKFMKAG